MRLKRVDRFKKLRKGKSKRIMFYFLVLPFVCAFAGYLITSLVILPSIIH